MPRNNSPARRAQRHADAVARQALVITCTRCGTRHGPRPCLRPVQPTPTARGFRRVLHALHRLTGWAWRGHHV